MTETSEWRGGGGWGLCTLATKHHIGQLGTIRDNGCQADRPSLHDSGGRETPSGTGDDGYLPVLPATTGLLNRTDGQHLAVGVVGNGQFDGVSMGGRVGAHYEEPVRSAIAINTQSSMKPLGSFGDHTGQGQEGHLIGKSC